MIKQAILIIFKQTIGQLMPQSISKIIQTHLKSYFALNKTLIRSILSARLTNFMFKYQIAAVRLEKLFFG